MEWNYGLYHAHTLTHTHTCTHTYMHSSLLSAKRGNVFNTKRIPVDLIQTPTHTHTHRKAHKHKLTCLKHTHTHTHTHTLAGL